MLDLREDFPSLHSSWLSRIFAISPEFMAFSPIRPQVVFHTAAHKTRPIDGKHIEDAVSNNIIGTKNIVQAASAIDTELLVSSQPIKLSARQM